MFTSDYTEANCHTNDILLLKFIIIAQWGKKQKKRHCGNTWKELTDFNQVFFVVFTIDGTTRITNNTDDMKVVVVAAAGQSRKKISKKEKMSCFYNRSSTKGSVVSVDS